MSWVAVAIGGSALVGAGASYLASESSSDSIESASEQTAETTAQTNAMLQRQYDQTREDNEPWRLAGEQALKEIQATPDFNFSSDDYDFFSDPSYSFRQQEGIDALDRSAASRGRLLSGGQDRAVTRYASDLASTEYGNAFNRAKTTFDTNLNTQKSLAGVGQQAVNATTAAGNSLTNTMANTATQATSSQNALTMADAQNTSNMATGVATSVNQGVGNYLLYNNLNNSSTTTAKG